MSMMYLLSKVPIVLSNDYASTRQRSYVCGDFILSIPLNQSKR